MEWKQWALIGAVAVLILIAARIGKGHGRDTRANRLMKKYAVLTPAVFAAIPADEQVDAVVSHVLAKTVAARRANPIQTLAQMDHAFTVVYSVWAVCKEMAVSDFAGLMSTATKQLVEPAREAMQSIGAPLCAQSLEAMRVAHTAGEAYDEAQQAFRVAVSQECPLSVCEQYIAGHAPLFTGEDAPT